MAYMFASSTYYSTFNNNSNVTSSLNLSTSNESIWTLNEFEFDQKEQNYFDLIETFLSLLSSVLNISTIINLLSMKKSLKTQIKLILSLAISDCMIAMLHFILRFFMFPNVLKMQINYVLNSTPGTILSFLYTTSQYAGLGTMCKIAVDILIKVWKPFKYRILMSKARGNFIVTCLWIVPMLLFITVALCLMYGPNTIKQSFIYDVGESFASASVIFVFCSKMHFKILCFLFLFIFVVIYTIIFCSVRRNTYLQHSNQRRSTLKMAFTFFLILISYFICMMPGVWISLLFYTNARNSARKFSRMINLMTCLYVLNTLIDPIIYAVRIPEIRERFQTCSKRVFHFPRSFL